MPFFTRPDLDDRQFKQEATSILTMSGVTNFFGTLKSKGVEIDASTGSTSGLSTANIVLGLIGDKIQLAYVSGGTGGSGSTVYTGRSPATCNVGGVSAGDPIAGCEFNDLFQQILAPAQEPTLTNPSNTFSFNQPTQQEIGNVVNISFTATFNQGCINPVYPPNTCDKRSGPPNTYNYTGSGLSSVPSTLLSDNQNVNGYTILQGGNTWSSSVSYDAGPQPYDDESNPFGSPLPAGTTGSINRTTTGYFCRFYGPDSATPSNSAEVRSLTDEAFQTANAQTFCLNTGAALTKFVVALPPSRTIASAFDLDALCANITSEYVCLCTISVNDGGGTGSPQTYNLYEMNIGAPYSSNHRHQLTTA